MKKLFISFLSIFIFTFTSLANADSYCNKKIRLKSWKNDYLHRKDTDAEERKVTAWNTGVGNEWTVECIEGKKIKLKSWKGDYLHRKDTDAEERKVTAWNTGIGNEWIVESVK